jgi:ankyrin repeat protein
MGYSCSDIVVSLIDAGARVDNVDFIGASPVTAACTVGRIDNLEVWFSKISNFKTINRKNNLGSTVLHSCLYLGTNNILNIVKYLVKKLNADLDVIGKSGHTILTLACSNDDCDPQVIRYLLQDCGERRNVNKQVQPQTTKWKMLSAAARFAVRTRLTRSKFIRRIGESSGRTALHYAARRGDVEIVELLMEFGADPFIKNDLGRDVLSYCEAFPDMRCAIERVKREENRFKNQTNCPRVESVAMTKEFTLQRKIATATPVKYNMYLMNLATMMKLFGNEEDRKKNLNLSHQDLLQSEKLIGFEDLPMSSFVIFVSHQWNGFEHPDPNGVQIECLVNIFRRLRDGDIESVHMETYHQFLYKHNVTTKHAEWKQLLLKSYFWFDFWCQPRHSRDAAMSVGAYVERSDCLVALAPGTVHSEWINSKTGRKMYTCYRTYRRRAFCVLEMFCSLLSTRKTYPILLIRSAQSIPQWISPSDSLRLSIGDSDFTCCHRNHLNNVPCDRHVAREIMLCMISKKVRFLFSIDSMTKARLLMVRQHFLLRGLNDDRSLSLGDTVQSFRNTLKFTNRRYFDRNGVSILIYAVAACVDGVVSEILKTVKLIKNIDKRMKHLNSVIREKGFPSIGIPGKATVLGIAMFLSSSKIVTMLLEAGADPHRLDAIGTTPIFYACASGQIENVKTFLKYIPDCDLNQRDHVFGTVCLNTAAHWGPKRYDLVELLIDRGASIEEPWIISNHGSSIIQSLASSDDCDPETLKFFLKLSHGTNRVNFRSRPRIMRWKLLSIFAKLQVRMKRKCSNIIRMFAENAGAGAIHFAAVRNDIEIVQILLSSGADPSMKNDLGHDAATLCQTFPELYGLLKKRQRKMKLINNKLKAKRAQNLGIHNTIIIEALGKRLSTATPIQHTMWLISLETLLTLYGREGKSRVLDAHQDLLEKNLIVRWADVPSDAEIVFVSHEWLSWAHPDPQGEQLRVLCCALQRLRDGHIERVDMDPLHTIAYKHNFSTNSTEWSEMLKKTYLWIDWVSMPQPSAQKRVCLLDKLRADSAKAIRSIPAYVIMFDDRHSLTYSLLHHSLLHHSLTHFCITHLLTFTLLTFTSLTYSLLHYSLLHHSLTHLYITHLLTFTSLTHFTQIRGKI